LFKTPPLKTCSSSSPITTALLCSSLDLPRVTDSTPSLLQLQCSLFSTTFNPTNARLGNKILRQRLKGPALAAYYPRKSATVKDIQKEFARFDLVTWNEEEEDRLEGLQIAKLRGKGAPKKKRTAEGEFLPVPCLPTGPFSTNWKYLLTWMVNSEQERQEEKEVTHTCDWSYNKCTYTHWRRFGHSQRMLRNHCIDGNCAVNNTIYFFTRRSTSSTTTGCNCCLPDAQVIVAMLAITTTPFYLQVHHPP
jgi:small subunit ribosomal protein S33